MNESKKKVTIHSDGSCLGNPGPGGWAALLRCGSYEKELSGGFARTTNNRMEILAAIMGLEALQEACSVDLYTDSRYVSDAVTKGWLLAWQRSGWRTADKKPVKNRDLWERLNPLLARHQVRLHWVAGHTGYPENERVDMLARTVAAQGSLSEDLGFPDTAYGR